MVSRHLEPSALYCTVTLLLMLGACLKASCMLVSQLLFKHSWFSEVCESRPFTLNVVGQLAGVPIC